MKKQTISTQKLVLTALMAALTIAGSALRIKVPVDLVGTSAFHLGNILCALSGILLGPWLGGLAAALGSAIFDMLDPMYISECWITFLTKGAYGLIAGGVYLLMKKHAFSRLGKFPEYPCALTASIAGALTYAVLYLSKTYFYGGLLLQGLTPAAALTAVVAKLPATIFNAAVAIIGAPLLAMALIPALRASHLLQE